MHGLCFSRDMENINFFLQKNVYVKPGSDHTLFKSIATVPRHSSFRMQPLRRINEKQALERSKSPSEQFNSNTKYSLKKGQSELVTTAEYLVFLSIVMATYVLAFRWKTLLTLWTVMHTKKFCRSTLALQPAMRASFLRCCALLSLFNFDLVLILQSV